MLEKYKTKLLYILMFLPLLVIDYNSFSADTYWMVMYGEHIINTGFFDTIPFTVHNFYYLPQQWLTDVLMYYIYKYFNIGGSLIYVYISTFIAIYLFFKIIKLITNDLTKSQIFTFVFAIPFSIIFSQTRPQMISYICCLSLILCLEKYIRNTNIKYLFFIPFLFILQINSHATCWPFLVMIYMAYIIKFLKTKDIYTDNYKNGPLYISLVISCICFLINPYGYNSITYIFKCFSSDIQYVSYEMQNLTIENYGIFVLLLLLILFILFYNYKEKINLRYLLLLIGSLILTFINIRSLVYLLIGFIIFVADYTKNVTTTENLLRKVFGYYEIMIPGIIIVALIARIVTLDNFTLNNFACRGSIDYSTNGIVDAIKNDTQEKHPYVYAIPAIGGYLQFNDFYVYMNSGHEPFLKSENKEKDIIEEYLLLQWGRVDEKEFIDEYNFDYLILNKTDYLQDYAKKNLKFIYSNGDFDIYKCY